ncbi:unnamed protein product [Prunus armeniaca]
MGSVNTPATPTTRATSQHNHNHSTYDGTHPALYGVCQHAGYSYDTCDLNTISPHTTGRTRPRMGSVNTPATPTTRATSQHNHNHSTYDGTHPALYGVCQHAGYSYDTCDLNFGPGYILISPHTIISPLIRRNAPGHVWGLSTHRLLLRHVRPHDTITITPHTTGRTRPCMGSVNTPATPTTHATSTLGLATFSSARTQ